MSKTEHEAKHGPGDKPTQDEVAKKAYGIYVEEGRPQRHADQNWLDAEARLQHAGVGQPDHPEHQDAHKGHQDHHAHMAADFRKRFWISLVLTLPILALSPLRRLFLRRKS